MDPRVPPEPPVADLRQVSAGDLLDIRGYDDKAGFYKVPSPFQVNLGFSRGEVKGKTKREKRRK